MLSIIVAADKQGAIGRENKIPWRIRSDLVRLANMTRNHTVILGRKSYDSMVWYYDKSGRPMPGSHYIVVTRDQTYQPARENALIVHSVPAAIEAGKKLDDAVFVIGGGAIFAETLPLVDRVYLTEVQTVVPDGDAFFPKLNMTEWREVSREHFPQDERDEVASEFITYERI